MRVVMSALSAGQLIKPFKYVPTGSSRFNSLLSTKVKMAIAEGIFVEEAIGSTLSTV